jgi:hypothetical protein
MLYLRQVKRLHDKAPDDVGYPERQLVDVGILLYL